jgi:hypothetical protein
MRRIAIWKDIEFREKSRAVSAIAFSSFGVIPTIRGLPKNAIVITNNAYQIAAFAVN